MLYHSLRDIYPNVTKFIATNESTIPEPEEQKQYGVNPQLKKTYTWNDFWKILGLIAVLSIILLVIGHVTE